MNTYVLRESILAVPMGTYPKPGLASVAGWNRYDTDDEHVLHLWSSDQSHQGESWDFRASKLDRASADKNVDLLIAVLERIALALEGKNAPVVLNLPRDFTVGEVRTVMAEWSKEAAGK